MIYTCYEMVQDCRGGESRGWRFFVRQYVPVIRRLLAHYGTGQTAIDPVLIELRRPETSIFRNLEPLLERPFLAELRQEVLRQLAPPVVPPDLDLDTLAAAWQPLTLVERQAAWLESMGYSAAETGEMLRMSAATVEKIRARGADLIRARMDTWSSGILSASGLSLGRAAAAAAKDGCLPAKTFLDIVDGRATWRGREEMEQHVLGCWHCIDYFCRLLEVVELLRGVQPLTSEEAAPFENLLGIEPPKKSAWKRWFGA